MLFRWDKNNAHKLFELYEFVWFQNKYQSVLIFMGGLIFTWLGCFASSHYLVFKRMFRSYPMPRNSPGHSQVNGNERLFPLAWASTYGIILLMMRRRKYATKKKNIYMRVHKVRFESKLVLPCLFIFYFIRVWYFHEQLLDSSPPLMVIQIRTCEILFLVY